MIYKNKNILFIILLIFIILAIALLNYFVDPYNVIHKTSVPFKMYEYPRNMYSAAIKLSKDTKYDYLVIGGSATHVFVDPGVLNSSNVIYSITSQFDIVSELSYLDFILKVHPEIKTIVFPVEYLFYYFPDKTIPLITPNTNLTIKDIITLFINLDTTKESIRKLKKLMQNKYNDFESEDAFEKSIMDEFVIKEVSYTNWYRRNYSHCFHIRKHDENRYRLFVSQRNDNLKEIKNIIGDRKIIFIFPPYHSILQSTLYLDNNYYLIENVKKFLVENYPKADIYDFAYVNKYTTLDTQRADFYSDVAHPNGHYGTFYYCALKYPEEFKNKDVFVKLTKDNIDKTLEWQRARLKDYSAKNSTYVRNFMSTNKLDNEKYYKKTIDYLPKNCQWYIENY